MTCLTPTRRLSLRPILSRLSLTNAASELLKVFAAVLDSPNRCFVQVLITATGASSVNHQTHSFAALRHRRTELLRAPQHIVNSGPCLEAATFKCYFSTHRAPGTQTKTAWTKIVTSFSTSSFPATAFHRRTTSLGASICGRALLHTAHSIESLPNPFQSSSTDSHIHNSSASVSDTLSQPQTSTTADRSQTEHLHLPETGASASASEQSSLGKAHLHKASPSEHLQRSQDAPPAAQNSQRNDKQQTVLTPERGTAYLVAVMDGKINSSRPRCQQATLVASTGLNSERSQSVAWAVWTVGKLCQVNLLHRSDSSVKTLVDAANTVALQQLNAVAGTSNLNFWNPIDICQLLAGYSAIGVIPSSELLQQLMQRTCSNLELFGSFELSRLLCALATLQSTGVRVPDARPNQTPACYSLADPAHLVPILQQAHWHIRSMRADHMVNILWSVATLRHPINRKFLSDLCAVAEKKSRHFTPCEHAMFLWSLGELHAEAPMSLVHLVLEEASRKLHEFAPGDFSLMMTGLAKLQCSKEQQCQAFVSELLVLARELLPRFQPGDFSKLLSSLVQLRHKVPLGFMGDVLTAARQKLYLFTPQQVSTLLWSLARLRTRVPPEFVQDAMAGMQEELEHLHPVEVCDVMWALDELRHDVPSGFLSALHAVMRKQGGAWKFDQVKRLRDVVNRMETGSTGTAD